jgi:hypothetical protein
MKTVLKLAAVAAAVVALVAVGTAASSGKKVIHDDGNRVTKVIHDDGLRGTALYDAVTGKVIGYQVPVSATVLAGCSVGTETFCVYTSTSYTGSLAVYAAPNGGWSDCINFSYPFDDSVDSAKNRSSRHLTLYTSYNGTGTGLGFGAASSTGNIAASAPGFGNNTASSLCDR